MFEIRPFQNSDSSFKCMYCCGFSVFTRIKSEIYFQTMNLQIKNFNMDILVKMDMFQIKQNGLNVKSALNRIYFEVCIQMCQYSRLD